MSRAVETGRRATRSPCPSCEMRYKVGEPKASDSWPVHLTLSPLQVDLLLVAAAEFRDLCDEAGEYDHAVDFVDWIRIDALRPSFGSPVNVQREAASAANRTPLRLHSTSKKVGL